MNRNYECMVLLDNREVRQGWDALKDNVAGMLTKHGASVISSKLWEERRLAFSVKRQLRGTYLLVYFDAPTNAVAPINRELRMAEPVLRHMVTMCEEIPESAHEPEKEFDVSAIGIEKEPEPEPAPAAADKADESDEADKGGEKASGDAKAPETTGTPDAPAEGDASAESEKEDS